jgi:hypothetical protein
MPVPGLTVTEELSRLALLIEPASMAFVTWPAPIVVAIDVAPEPVTGPVRVIVWLAVR